MKYYLTKCKLRFDSENKFEYFECKYMNGVRVYWEYYRNDLEQGSFIPTVIEKITQNELN